MATSSLEVRLLPVRNRALLTGAGPLCTRTRLHAWSALESARTLGSWIIPWRSWQVRAQADPGGRGTHVTSWPIEGEFSIVFQSNLFDTIDLYPINITYATRTKLASYIMMVTSASILEAIMPAPSRGFSQTPRDHLTQPQHAALLCVGNSQLHRMTPVSSPFAYPSQNGTRKAICVALTF